MNVFDFDKTLIDKDTLFGFYKFIAGKSSFFVFKKVCLLVIAVFYKIGLINNDRLKSIGIWLFLKGKERSYIKDSGSRYAATLKLNDVYQNYYKDLPSTSKLVISASLIEYLSPLFSDENLIASTLLYKNNIVVGLDCNMYGEAKREALAKRGLYKINRFFTDSFVDAPLMELADEVFLVSNGKVSKLEIPINK